jgi:hypothetical protein
MLGPSGVVDQSVIKENEHEPPEVCVEHVVLEGGGHIGEAERHDQKIEVAMVRSECRLGDVVWVHQHLVVAAAEVELGEVAPPLSSSRSSSTTGIGNLSFTVLALRAR